MQELEQLRRSRATELARTRAQWQQLRESLGYYDTTGLALATALRHDADRAYRSGQASYIELLQAMEQARQIEADHLGIRYQLALTVLHLNALLGQ